MKRKVVSGTMLTLLLIGMLTLAFNTQPVKADGTIYIRADGSVDPPTAPIQRDGDVYTFTDDIYDSIVVQRDNIIIDGNNQKLQGSGADYGFDLSYRNNVTITKTSIRAWRYGIYLWYSSHNIIIDNVIEDCAGFFDAGIDLHYRNNKNIIRGNKIANNFWGIISSWSDDNLITFNMISNSFDIGIFMQWSEGNAITSNDVKNNYYGIVFDGELGPNMIYHNNFLSNIKRQALEIARTPVNIWDDGYPSGGNYWSDYTTRYPVVGDKYQGENQDVLGSDGIWDYPYEIEDFNQDNYPLVNPWTPTIEATIDIDPDTLNLKSKGQWITAYIQLPEEYNPENIDATTILLNETIPPVLDPKYDFVTNSSEYIVDHDGDGILERMVKFNRTEVASWICNDLGIQYGNATLTITGELFDGTPFEGTDTIKVLFPGDVDDDGDVDLYDFGLFAAAYGTSLADAAYNWAADFNEDQSIDRYDLGILAEYYGKTAA